MSKFEFYDEWHSKRYLQLHDHHTIWNIDQPFDWWEYNNYVDVMCFKMQQHFKNLEVFLLGRSGRHVCVEDTPVNRRRYDDLVSYAENLEQDLINYFNNKEEL